MSPAKNLNAKNDVLRVIPATLVSKPALPNGSHIGKNEAGICEYGKQGATRISCRPIALALTNGSITP